LHVLAPHANKTPRGRARLLHMRRRNLHPGFALAGLSAFACIQTPADAADLQRGALLFQSCAACHNVLGDGVGPDLTGIYGQKAGLRPDFKYSAALKASGLVWNEANLRALIRDPQALVKGTLMTFPGYTAPADIDAVIAYIKTLK
jgi:cytochrome c